MKKNLYILVALILVASFTIAAGGGKNESKLYGTIEDIDYGARTFTILVETPLRYKDATITVQATAATTVKNCVDGISSRVSFNDLVEGNYVRVTGTFSSSVFVASMIIQYP